MIFDTGINDDEGMYQVVPIHPSVVPERQKQLKSHYLPKGGLLCVKMSLTGAVDSRNKIYYPYGWTLLDRKNLIMRPFDDDIPHHILTDNELIWLFGDFLWVSTALRFNGKKYSCKAFRIIYPRGAEITPELIKRAFPLATKYLSEKDYNIISEIESYSYDVAETDYALCVFLQHYNIVIEGMYRWEVPWNEFAF